jgi:hypothetical protein
VRVIEHESGHYEAVHDDVSQEPEEGSLHPWLEDYEEWRRERDARDLRHEYFVFVEESDA